MSKIETTGARYNAPEMVTLGPVAELTQMGNWGHLWEGLYKYYTQNEALVAEDAQQ